MQTIHPQEIVRFVWLAPRSNPAQKTSHPHSPQSDQLPLKAGRKPTHREEEDENKICPVSVSKYGANSDYRPAAAAIASGLGVAFRFPCLFNEGHRTSTRPQSTTVAVDSCHPHQRGYRRALSYLEANPAGTNDAKVPLVEVAASKPRPPTSSTASYVCTYIPWA